jgi:hypothetical protein
MPAQMEHFQEKWWPVFRPEARPAQDEGSRMHFIAAPIGGVSAARL